MTNSTKKCRLIQVPYDSGMYNERIGKGPFVLTDALSSLLHKKEVQADCVCLHSASPYDIKSAFELHRKIAEAVRESVKEGFFPAVLSGNCNASVGALAGLNDPGIGLIWLDAHADCETPETTGSGFLDGMGLSMINGGCWQSMLRSLPGYTCLDGNRIGLIGARDMSDSEQEYVAASEIKHITVRQIRENSAAAINLLLKGFINSGVSKIHLHLDLDVLDPSIAPANYAAVENGLLQSDLIKIVSRIKAALPVTSLSAASYDPGFDKQGKLLLAGSEIIAMVIS